jgi:uridine phosphorylase
MVIDGKQYHIDCSEGDLAEYILLCGDPARSEKTAQHFDDISFETKHREYVTFTGKYKGVPVSVMSTGIGPDNMEIAVVEISRTIANPTLIRIGSCGGMQDNIAMGDLVVSTGAVRLENTSLYYVREGYPAVADYRVVQSLCAAARDTGARFHIGLTATAPSFYAAQSRYMDDFPTREGGLLEELYKCKVANYEMESSTLFTLAHLREIKAGCVCAAYSTRHDNKPITHDQKEKAEKECLLTGLGALQYLERIKKEKKVGVKENIWLPF